MEALQNWNRDAISDELMALAEGMELKIRDFLSPIFIAIAGSSASISVMDSMELLGPDMSRARLRHAVNLLGSVGKKQLKKLEKEYKTIA